MTKEKHSPGEWTAVRNSIYWEVRSSEHGGIGDACSSQHLYVDGDPLTEDRCEEIARANAHMFAASKDMYEALVHIKSQLQHPDEMIDNALAKARGEP